MTKDGTATNKTISEIYHGLKEGTIKLNPDFQRKLVWNNRHKENFIDTILKNYPFPEIYFCNGKIDLNTKKTTKLVVDGQQRLSTIYQYIEGKISGLKKVPLFSELNEEVQENFLEYLVVVRDLAKISEDNIKEIFRRINSVNYALNAMEIRHALYDGEFISVAQKISKLFFDKFPVFGETQISRMRDVEFFLQIMATIEMGGYFTGNGPVEDLTKNYNEKYPNKEQISSLLKNTLSLIKEMDLNKDGIWFKKSSFFTLVVELIRYKVKVNSFPKTQDLKEELTLFEKTIERNKTNERSENEYSQYYYYTYQGTNSKAGRRLRGILLRKHLEKISPP